MDIYAYLCLLLVIRMLNMWLQDIINNLMASHPPAVPIHDETNTEPMVEKLA